MPTKEQIRSLEITIHKRHFDHQSKGLHDWKKVTVEEQQIFFCPECSERFTRIFGGHYLYVYSAQGVKRSIERAAVKKFMAEGKSAGEISKLLNIPEKRIFILATRLAKRGVRSVRI